jgi:hypothetical protein
MSVPALAAEGMRLRVDETALAERRLRLAVDGGVLRLSAAGLSLLMEQGGLPVQLERIDGGKLHLRAQFGGVRGNVEVALSAAPTGRLQAAVTAFRAAGFLPIPISALMWAARSFAPAKPGLHWMPGDRLEVDLAEIARSQAPPEVELALAPLREVRTGTGLLELRF